MYCLEKVSPGNFVNKLGEGYFIDLGMIFQQNFVGINFCHNQNSVT